MKQGSLLDAAPVDAITRLVTNQTTAGRTSQRLESLVSGDVRAHVKEGTKVVSHRLGISQDDVVLCWLPSKQIGPTLAFSTQCHRWIRRSR